MEIERLSDCWALAVDTIIVKQLKTNIFRADIFMPQCSALFVNEFQWVCNFNVALKMLPFTVNRTYLATKYTVPWSVSACTLVHSPFT